MALLLLKFKRDSAAGRLRIDKIQSAQNIAELDLIIPRIFRISNGFGAA